MPKLESIPATRAQRRQRAAATVVFEEERASLVPYRGPFDGLHAVQASVSKTCLVRFDS